MTKKESIPQVDLVEAQTHSSKGPGMRLREAREKTKMSLSEVANQLHLATRYVEAMEQDNYEATPNRVFVRGYLRSYAKLLNLPDDEILTAFDALGVVDKQVETPTSVLSVPGRVSLEDLTPWIIAVFLIGMALLLFFWWRSQHPNVENNSFSSFSQDKATNAAALPSIPFTPKLNKLESIPPVTTLKNKSTTQQIPAKPLTPPKVVNTPAIQNQQNQPVNPSVLTPSTATSQPAPANSVPANSGAQQAGQINSQAGAQGSARYKSFQPPVISGSSVTQPLPATSTINPAVFPLHNSHNTTNSNTLSNANVSDSTHGINSNGQPALKKLKVGSKKQKNKSTKKRHIVIDSPF